MKILYCCQHPASTLKAICHKLHYFYNDEALIITEGKVYRSYFNVKTLNYNCCTSVFGNTSKNELLLKVNSFVSHYIADNNFDFDGFDKIFVMFDMFNVWAMYFSLNSIKYNIIEFNNNQLSYLNSEDFKKRILPASSLFLFDLLSYEHAIYSPYNESVQSIQFFSNSSKNFLSDSKEKVTKEFFNDFFNCVLDNYNDLLRAFFEIHDFKTDNNSVLLTNSFGYTLKYIQEADLNNFFQWKDFNDTENSVDDKSKNLAFFYLSSIDYILHSKNVCIKLHPASAGIEKYINGITCLEKTIPFEIIKNDFSEYFCFLHTTTFIDEHKVFCLGVEYSKYFYQLPFVYWALNICKELIGDINKSIYLNNININITTRIIDSITNGSYSPILFDFNSKTLNDKSLRLPNIYLFNDCNDLLSTTLSLMNPYSIIFLNDAYHCHVNPLDGFFYLNFNCSHVSSKFDFQNSKLDFSIIVRDLLLFNRIFELTNVFSSWNLTKSETTVNINKSIGSINYLNLLNHINLNCVFSTNDQKTLSKFIYQKIDDKILVYESFYTKAASLRLQPNENIICLIDDSNTLTKVDTVSGCEFHFKGNNNIVIIHKNTAFQNTRIEAANNCFYFFHKSSFKVSINIGNLNNDNIKFVIDKNFSCPSNCKIVLPNYAGYIGQDCMFSYDVEIRSTDWHSILSNRGDVISNKDYLFIGNHIWIGNHVRILKNTYINDNSIIGSSAVVKGNFIHHSCIIAGNPAKIVKRDMSWSRQPNAYFIN